MNIGENIKKHRKNRGLTQVQLAKEIKKSESTIQKYESNSVIPDFSTLADISNILRVDINELIGIESGVNVNDNRDNIKKSIDKEISKTLDATTEEKLKFESKMDYLYKTYFSDLFFWKTSKLNAVEFFKFILSMCSVNEAQDLTERDIEEISILFYRVLQLKSAERYSLTKGNEVIPGHIEIYENRSFLSCNNTKDE